MNCKFGGKSLKVLLLPFNPRIVCRLAISSLEIEKDSR